MIENLEPIAGSERSLDEIRAELSKLKAAEVAGESKTAHFVPKGKYLGGMELMVEELSDEDLRLFDRLSRYPALGEVTEDELKAISIAADESGNASRRLFKGLLGNIFLLKVLGPRHLEERQKEQ